MSNDKKILKDKYKDKFIKTNNIIITRAGKGNVTVILSKEEYKQKSLELLDDSTTYYYTGSPESKGDPA